MDKVHLIKRGPPSPKNFIFVIFQNIWGCGGLRDRPKPGARGTDKTIFAKRSILKPLPIPVGFSLSFGLPVAAAPLHVMDTVVVPDVMCVVCWTEEGKPLACAHFLCNHCLETMCKKRRIECPKCRQKPDRDLHALETAMARSLADDPPSSEAASSSQRRPEGEGKGKGKGAGEGQGAEKVTQEQEQSARSRSGSPTKAAGAGSGNELHELWEKVLRHIIDRPGGKELKELCSFGVIEEGSKTVCLPGEVWQNWEKYHIWALARQYQNFMAKAKLWNASPRDGGFGHFKQLPVKCRPWDDAIGRKYREVNRVLDDPASDQVEYENALRQYHLLMSARVPLPRGHGNARVDVAQLRALRDALGL